MRMYDRAQPTLRYFLTLALLSSIAVITSACTNDSDILSFDVNNGDQNDFFAGEYAWVPCCANAFIGSIEWYRNDTGTMRSFSPNSTNYEFQNNHQRLDILKISMEDGGLYRCVARNETHTVTQDYRLVVHPCNEVKNGIKVETVPAPEVLVAPYEELTLPCRGTFGCGQPGSSKRVFWTGKGIVRLEGNNTLFSVQTTEEKHGTLLGASLTFHRVTEDNYTSEYTCWLVHSPKLLTFTVKLKKPDTTVTPVPLETLFLLILLLPFIVIGITYPWRQRIIFWLKTKLHRLPRRYDSDNVDTDVTVLCSSTNCDFVQESIVQPLRTFRYSVYFHDDDGQPGKSDAISLLEGLNRSSHGLLYLSKTDEVEKFHDFFMDAAIRLHGGSRVVVVYEGSFSQSLRNLQPGLRERLKMIKRFQFPEGSNKRIHDNFWCSVRSCLPDVSQPDIGYNKGNDTLL